MRSLIIITSILLITASCDYPVLDFLIPDPEPAVICEPCDTIHQHDGQWVFGTVIFKVAPDTIIFFRGDDPVDIYQVYDDVEVYHHDKWLTVCLNGYSSSPKGGNTYRVLDGAGAKYNISYSPRAIALRGSATHDEAMKFIDTHRNPINVSYLMMPFDSAQMDALMKLQMEVSPGTCAAGGAVMDIRAVPIAECRLQQAQTLWSEVRQ